MEAGQKKAKRAPDVWKDSLWGSREEFIRSSLEKFHDPELAESDANDWSEALEQLSNNPPSLLTIE